MTDVQEAAATVRDALRTVKSDAKAVPALAALAILVEQAENAVRWLAWSDGQYPDDSPGDVIAAYQDGTIVLDDGITTWNPVRACAYFARRAERAASLRDALEQAAQKHDLIVRTVRNSRTAPNVFESISDFAKWAAEDARAALAAGSEDGP